jgi:hypothetical protein
MPERSIPVRSSPAPWRRRLARLVLPVALAAAATAAAACTELVDGGAACPSLCPGRSSNFLDTTFEAVAVDTTLGGFPTLGLSEALLLAHRPDSVETVMVMRFDELPSEFLRNNGAELDSITAVDSAWLRLRLDTLGRRGATAMLLEAFDVDTTDSDTSSGVVRSLFRPDRRIGGVTVTPADLGDSLRVPIDTAVLARKIRDRTRLRVGLRLSGGSGQLLVSAFAGGQTVPVLSFDPATDTLYRPLIVDPATSIEGGAPTDVLFSYLVYRIVDRGTPPPGDATLQVGGYPAWRTYLRFNVPRRITDSSTIVRAELLLTQRSAGGIEPADTLRLEALIPTTTDVVTDLRRILDLAAPGIFAGFIPTSLVPADSGTVPLNVLTLVRSWRALPDEVPRALAFGVVREGQVTGALRFHSREAADPSVRPRLRITYLPRSEFARP